MQPKTLTVAGVEYRVRYTYKRDDGSLWFVLDTNGETVPTLKGEFGDEWPAEKVG
jgi:hypothetical protein